MKLLRFNSLGVSAGGLLVGAIVATACGSSSSDGKPSGAGGAAGSSGAPSTGGAATTGGASGTGGTPGAGGMTTPAGKIGAADAKITGTTVQCPGTMPKDLPTNISVDACTIAGCQQAACLTPDLIGSVVSPVPDLTLLGKCSDGAAYCVPLDYIATTGNFKVKTCTSVEGAEGRCISTCIPAVQKDLAFLPQADCGANERCAPCWEPRDGTDTKACRQGCDTGPTMPAIVFKSCAEGAGQCVPTALVPDDLKPSVPKADCTQDGHVCAPLEKVKDLDYQFPACTPSSTLLNGSSAMKAPNGQLGGCVPHYLVDNFMPAPPMGVVMQDTCKTGEFCAPCYNPLSNNSSTGACPSK